MNLLQEILDEIEARAKAEAATAIAHAGAIIELQTLAETLRKHGADDFIVCPTMHEHNKSATLRIIVRADHASVITALLDAEMVYSNEPMQPNKYDPSIGTLVRIMGMTPYIELINYAIEDYEYPKAAA